MSIRHVEYLIMSALSYCIFKKEDIGKNVFDLLENDDKARERILLKNNVLFAFDFLGGWKTIGKNILDFLREWSIVDILDRTNDGDSEVKSGFYGIAFGKKDSENNFKDIVIAYRGSQLFPAIEAYRDFIETDLLIGLGKKPKQFEEGLEFYKILIRKYPYQNIRITGHSLGGGIAQYVAVMSSLSIVDKTFVPKTITFNGIGILVEDMIKIEDFLEFTEAKEIITAMGHENKWDKIYKLLLSIFTKNLSNSPHNKQITLNDFEIKTFFSQYFFITGATIKEKEIMSLIHTLNNCITSSNYAEGLALIDEFTKNIKYLTRVKNFVHSEDFTASFFPHIGRTIYINKNLKEKIGKVNKKIPLNFKAFQKDFMTYHLFDVFVPYISVNYGTSLNDTEFYLSKEINLLYVAASLRKLAYDELLSKEVLILFYKQKRVLSDKELLVIKNLILNDINSIKEVFLYKKELALRIESLDSNEFKSVWFEALDRMVSPFEQKDIYDHILYIYNLKEIKNIIKLDSDYKFLPNNSKLPQISSES